MAYLAVFSAILAIVASQVSGQYPEDWTFPEKPPVYPPPEPGPVYSEPEPPVYDLPEPPPVDSPPVYLPPPVPGYGPVGYGSDPLQELRESVRQKIQEMKSKIASVMEFRDVTLVSIEKISSLTAAWCRSKYLQLVRTVSVAVLFIWTKLVVNSPCRRRIGDSTLR